MRIQIEHLWRAVPFLLVIWISSLAPLPALDFWWHLKAGEIIWTTGSIPATDIFSYTAAGKTYLLQNWLGEVILYLIYRSGGPALVIFFNTLLLVGTLLPVYLLCLRHADTLRAGILAACLAAVPLACQGNIRPQVFSFLLFAWFYFVLSEFRDRNRNLLWLLPVLMAFWVNLHGAFILGIVLVVLYLGLDLAAPLFEKGPRLAGRQRVTLLLALVLTTTATLVNPQVTHIYTYVADVASDPVSRRYVVEWRPPQVDNLGDVLRFFGPFLLGIFILIRAKTRPDLRDTGLFLALALFALTSRRNAAWFALVAAPIVASHFRIGLPFRLGELQTRRAQGFNLVLAGLLMVLTVLGLPWFHRGTGQDRDLSLLEAGLPVRAADFILSRGIKGRIFHPQRYGDYLIWRLHPVNGTFLDGRVHLFSMEVAEDYFAILQGNPGWEDIAARYSIRYLLLDRNEPDEKKLLKALTGNRRWQKLYEDKKSVLFGQLGPPASS
ncbi:MAG: hypothetical protein ACE15E_06230 [Acidobacteriota bacterium]